MLKTTDHQFSSEFPAEAKNNHSVVNRTEGEDTDRHNTTSTAGLPLITSTTLQPIESQIKIPGSSDFESKSSTFNPLKANMTRKQAGDAQANNQQLSGQQRQTIRLTIPAEQQNLLMQSGTSSQTSGLNITDAQIEFLKEKYMKYCPKCKCVKPPRTHHCSKCGRCVLRMDHHCRWVDNCVGQRNLKIFLNFIFYLSINCLYTGVAYFTEGIQCLLERNSSDGQMCQGDSIRLSIYITITTGVSMLSILVAAFCICLLGN